jgi:hypothetical protein
MAILIMVIEMISETKAILMTALIVTLIFTSIGCVDLTDEDSDFDISDTEIQGKYMGKNYVEDSIVKITSVKNSPKAEEIYALIEDPNGILISWHAFGENPGNRHPISAISHIDISRVADDEDISWNDIYEDHKLLPDEKFFISKDIIGPMDSGYKFILEYKDGERILEVEIESVQKDGSLKDIEFYIEVEDNNIDDGKFELSCYLKNKGSKSYIISGAGLGYTNLNFYIYTPENWAIRYMGPFVECRCLPPDITLSPGEYYNWTILIGGEDQVWGSDLEKQFIDNYEFNPGSYSMYINYTSEPYGEEEIIALFGWKHSNRIYFTLENSLPSNGELKCEPEVRVTGYNYTSDPNSVPYQNVHRNFSGNYTGSDLSLELRNLTINSMLDQAGNLGENTTILYESIKVTYNDWNARPYRIPTYAEKAMYNNEWIWAIAFNRANGFEDGIGHFDLFFVSISTIQTQLSIGCNSTAIIYQIGCD